MTFLIAGIVFLLIVLAFCGGFYLAATARRGPEGADAHGRQWHVLIHDPRVEAYPYVIGPFPGGQPEAEAYLKDFEASRKTRRIGHRYVARLQLRHPSKTFDADKDLGAIQARFDLTSAFDRQEAREAEAREKASSAN